MKVLNRIAALSLAVAGVTPVWAATYTFDGGPSGTGTDLGTAANWSGDTLPDAALSDVGEFIGAVAGNLSLTYGGGIVGVPGNPGITLALTAAQTGSVSIDSGAVTTALRLGGNSNAVYIAPGAGAFTLGNGAGTFNLTLGGAGGTTQTFINDSSNVATINSDVVFNTGGGGEHTYVFGGAGDWAINNSITNSSGSVIIVKNGAGTATISGNTTTRGLRTDGGLTRITGGTHTFNPRFDGFALTNGGNFEIAGGSLTIQNTDTSWMPIGTTFGQTSTYTVNGGAVSVSNNFGVQVGQNGNGILTINAGSFTTTDTTGLGIKIAENLGTTGVLNLNGGTLKANLIGTSAGVGTFYFNGGTFSPTVSTTGWFNDNPNVSTEVRNGGAIINTAGLNVTIAESITHSVAEGTNAIDGGLTKAGAGTLTLTGANSYTGATQVNGGTLLLTAGSSNASNLVVNNGAFIGGGGSTSGSLTINAGGGLIVDPAAILSVNGATLTSTGLLAFNGTPIDGSTYDVLNYGAGGFTGNLANFSLSVRGVVTNNTGLQKLQVTIGGVGTRTWNKASGVWDINGLTNFAEGDLKFFNGDTVVFNNPASNSVVTLDASKGNLSPASVTISNTTNTYTFAGAGVIGGTATLTKNGAGTAIIATNNTYTGTTTINGGKLQIGDGVTDGEIAASSDIVNNGVLEFNRVGAGLPFAGTISGTGSLIKSGPGTQNLTGANTYSGGTTLTAGTLLVGGDSAVGTGTLTLAGGTLKTGEFVSSFLANPITAQTGTTTLIRVGTYSNFTFNGNITGNGNIDVGAIFNTNEVHFGGDNSGFAGALTVSGVNVRIDRASATSAAAAWVVNGALQLGGADPTNTYDLGSLSGSASGYVNSHVGGTSTHVLRVGALNTSTTYAGVIQNNALNTPESGNEAPTGNVLAVTKVGTGTLTLTGTNTYTGTTTVQAGTLRLGANAHAPVLTGVGGADVQGGKLVLDYTGGTSPVAQVKSILDAGYAGNFATGQIRGTTLAAGQTLGYGDNGTGLVTVRVTLPGDAELDGDVDFNDFLVLQNNFAQTGTRFDQANFNYDGVTDFNDFLALQNYFGQSVNGDAVAFSDDQVAALTAFAASPLNQAVPEPASLALIGLGAVGLMGRRRRSA